VRFPPNQYVGRGDSGGRGYADAYPSAYTDADLNAHADAFTDARAYGTAHGHADAFTDARAYGFADAHADAYRHPDTSRDTQPYAGDPRRPLGGRRLQRQREHR